MIYFYTKVTHNQVCRAAVFEVTESYRRSELRKKTCEQREEQIKQKMKK